MITKAPSGNAGGAFSLITNTIKMTLIKVGTPECNVSASRKAAMQSIKKLAKEAGVSVDNYVTAILTQSLPQLEWYVNSKGEVPLENPKLLAAQAVILRADDIATLAKAKNITDDEALAQIELAEQQAIDANSVDAVVLDPDVAAAVCLGVYELRKRSGGKLSDILGKMRAVSQADNFTLNVSGFLADPAFLQRGRFDNFDIPIPTGGPDITDVGGGSNDDDSGFDWGSIGDIFGSITDVINSVKGTSTSVGGTINGIIDKIKSGATDVGSASIQDALMKKLPIILVGILVVAVIIIIIAKYAGNRK